MFILLITLVFSGPSDELPEPGGYFGVFEPSGPPKMYEVLAPSEPGGAFDVNNPQARTGSKRSRPSASSRKAQPSPAKSLEKKAKQQLGLMRNYAKISNCNKLLELQAEFLAFGKEAVTPAQMLEAFDLMKTCRSSSARSAGKAILEKLVEWFPDSIQAKIAADQL